MLFVLCHHSLKRVLLHGQLVRLDLHLVQLLGLLQESRLLDVQIAQLFFVLFYVGLELVYDIIQFLLGLYLRTHLAFHIT